jgi:hypothetical protein
VAILKFSNGVDFSSGSRTKKRLVFEKYMGVFVGIFVSFRVLILGSAQRIFFRKAQKIHKN